jgi:hypothetical protein
MNRRNGSRSEGAPRLLLIGGRARSGTTLLRDLCNLHPEISLTHEFGTFMGLNEPYPAYRDHIVGLWRAQPILFCRIMRTRRMKRRLSSWALSMRGHVFALRYLRRIRRYGPGPIDLPAIEATLAELLPGAAFVGDKNPEYVHLLDKLAPTNGLSTVVIYRDCRDATSSYLKLARTTWRDKPWIRYSDTAEKIATRWVDAAEKMERHRDRIHIVRYEDLVQEPLPVLTNLAEWLGLDPEGFAARDLSFVHAKNIGKHGHGLTEREVEDVLRVAGSTMARLGYT